MKLEEVFMTLGSGDGIVRRMNKKIEPYLAFSARL